MDCGIKKSNELMSVFRGAKKVGTAYKNSVVERKPEKVIEVTKETSGDIADIQGTIVEIKKEIKTSVSNEFNVKIQKQNIKEKETLVVSKRSYSREKRSPK